MRPEQINGNLAVDGRPVFGKTVGIVQHSKGKVKRAYLTVDTFSWFIVGRIVSSPSF